MNRRGMTLMEVVVVMTILGIAVAAVVPAARRPASEGGAEHAAGEIASLFRGARRLAVERSTAVTVILDPASRRYWVDEEGRDSLVAGVLELGADVELVAAQPRVQVRFEPDGPARSDPLGVEAAGVRRALLVDRWTGEVSLTP